MGVSAIHNILLHVLFCLCLIVTKGVASTDGNESPSPVVSWSFDGIQESEKSDKPGYYSVRGNYEVTSGVNGEALKLDGFTTRISRAIDLSELEEAFSLDAWVAPATYPWNWVPIVAQQQNEQEGFYFGIGPKGEVGLFASVDGEWKRCVSTATIRFREWSYVSATFGKETGLKLYINGRLAGELSTKGMMEASPDVDLLIGMNRNKVAPSHPVRTYATLADWFSFDGIYDEINVYDEELSAGTISGIYKSLKPSAPPELPLRVMPSGPEGPARFGAYYAHLKYYNAWDKLFRVSSHPDIVVRFDDSPIRVVFWRGTRYSPAWVMENGQWMADQSAEYFDEIDGCFEHMIDPHCLYSHVRIIENTDARVVVHWRYVPVSVRKQFSQVDEITGWSDCIDEYYTFYPDGTGVRNVIQHTSGNPLGPSEAIVLCQPGTSPEDNVNQDAMTLINMNGDNYTYSWADGPPVFERGKNPTNPVIQVVNLKSEHKPFMIFEPGNKMEVFGIEHRKDVSSFPWWNHWPVAQMPSDGRYSQATDRPSHFSLAWGRPPFHKTGNNKYYSTWIYGASKQSPDDLARLSRSWITPPELKLSNDNIKNKGFDRTQRAFLLENTSKIKPGSVRIELSAAEESPLIYPCFVIDNWTSENLTLKAGKIALKKNLDFRTGIVRNLDGEDKLVLYVNKRYMKPVTFELTSDE